MKKVNDIKHYEWGDIIIYDFGDNEGSVQSGVRPALVIQTNYLNKRGTTLIIAAITSNIKKDSLPSHVILDTECGIKKRSMVMLEQLKTIDIASSKLVYVGSVTDESTIKKIKYAQKYVNGLLNEKNNRCNILCLCEDCKQIYFRKEELELIRYKPEERNKYLCDRCLKQYGHRYILIKNTRKSNKEANSKNGK